MARFDYDYIRRNPVLAQHMAAHRELGLPDFTEGVSSARGGAELAAYNNTCILIGDSRNERTYGYTDATNTSAYFGEKSLFAWLQYTSGAQFSMVAAAAKAGHDLAECLRDWEVLPPLDRGFQTVGYGFKGVDISNVRFAFVMLGVNSFALWDDTQDKARMEEILARLEGVKHVIWVLEPPCGSGSSLGALTFAQWNTNRKAFNSHLKYLASMNPKLTLLDMEYETIDSASLEGYCKVNMMNADGAGSTMGVHPTSLWYRLAAEKLWAILKPLVAARTVLPSSVADTFLVSGFKNAYPNTMLIAATIAASATGATASGQMPPGVVLTGTGTGISAVASVLPAEDDIGNSFVIDLSSNVAGTQVLSVNFTDLAAALNACSAFNKVKAAASIKFGKAGIGGQSILPFTKANPSGVISGMFRLRRSAYRTCYLLGPSHGATIDTSSATPAHTGVFDGVIESGFLDCSSMTGNYQNGATATYLDLKVKWQSDGTPNSDVRVVISKPTLFFE